MDDFPPIELPCLSTDWRDAQLIVDPAAIPARPPADHIIAFVNDFCLISDSAGHWHCIGIVSDHGNEDMFHAVAPSLTGPYRFLPRVESGQSGTGTYNMWAPFGIWDPDQRALLFYAHMEPHEDPTQSTACLRVLMSDGDLSEWQPYPNAATNAAFAEPHVRDPQIIWHAGRREYLCYYVVGDGWTDPEHENVVRVRTSTDLRTWGEPRTVLGCPPGYRSAESIFVLERNGLFYLWVCGFDYALMSLYVSDDALCFGDAIENRLLEMPGHAPEIVTIDGQDWIACVSVASSPGHHPAWHDLTGVRLQKLDWTPMSPELVAKIHRS